MNIRKDEPAVKRWLNKIQHRMNQQEGRKKTFENYKITVYLNTVRVEAPPDSNRYF